MTPKTWLKNLTIFTNVNKQAFDLWSISVWHLISRHPFNSLVFRPKLEKMKIFRYVIEIYTNYVLPSVFPSAHYKTLKSQRHCPYQASSSSTMMHDFVVSHFVCFHLEWYGACTTEILLVLEQFTIFLSEFVHGQINVMYEVIKECWVKINMTYVLGDVIID